MALPKKMRLAARSFHGRPREAVNTPFFSLKVRDTMDGGSRIGVVAGLAVHKSAVKRNFWRRQTQEILSGALTADAGKHPGEFLVILFPKVNTLTKRQFREKLLSAVRTLNAPRATK